jgi:VCBS repeat-containing protein
MVESIKIRPVLVLVTLLGMIAAMLAIVNAPEANAFPGANGKIAFAQDQDLWTMNADGTGEALLRTNGLAPAWSPDGQKLAFTDISTGDFEIWKMNANGSGVSSLTTGLSDFDPAWSPDGLWIAFSRRTTLTPPVGGTGTSTADNPAGTLLTDTVPNGFANVLPGMTVTNDVTGGFGEVISKSANTLVTTPLDPLGDGWDIGDTYTITAEGDRIFKIKSDGTGGLAALSTATVTDYYNDYTPSWSPDGTKIAYSTDRNGNDDIYVMLAAGEGAGAPTNLTPDVGLGEFLDVSWDPDWSPDGTKIVFSSAETGTGGSFPGNIWTMNFDGTSKAILTGVATVKDEAATWSPDGATIAFERTIVATEAESILAVPAAGGAATPLTSNAPKKDSRPDWQPMLGGVPDAYNVDEGDAVVVPAVGVLTNDLLFATGVGAATAVKDTDPANGTVTLNSDGSFTYTHNDSDTTTDSFTYHPVQGGIAGSVATVTITVTPVSDAPVAVDDGPFSVGIGGVVTRSAPGVLANDTDDGGSLTAVKVSDPSHGSVTLNSDGSFTYTHNGDTAVTDSFTYQAKDSGSLTSNIATVSFTIGAMDPHSVGLVDPSQGKWYLYDPNGVLETSFFYGVPGDYPFMGDWDGDGVETPGLYRQSDGFVYLSNSNAAIVADVSFFFGNPGDVPIAGDFNNNGFDTVSIYRPSNQTFYIINELGEDGGGLGAAEFSYVFGNPGDKPFVGDFDGDGVETVGLHRESTGFVYYRNEHSTGNAQNEFFFGDPGDRLIAGDWTGDATFTPGLFRPSNTTMYFKHTNTQGNADDQFIPTPGNPTWLPVSGSR